MQGCSIFEPVRERAYTSETQASNRRVEVEATATLVEDLQDKSLESKAATAPIPEVALIERQSEFLDGGKNLFR